MIKSDGKHVVVNGNPIELIQDFVNIMIATREVFTAHLGSERADEIISLCGRYAYADDESGELFYAERLAEIFLEVKENDIS